MCLGVLVLSSLSLEAIYLLLTRLRTWWLIVWPTVTLHSKSLQEQQIKKSIGLLADRIHVVQDGQTWELDSVIDMCGKCFGPDTQNAALRVVVVRDPLALNSEVCEIIENWILSTCQ